MVATIFKPGDEVVVGDVVHPAEGEPSRVVSVEAHGRRSTVTLASGTTADLDCYDAVEVEVAQ